MGILYYNTSANSDRNDVIEETSLQTGKRYSAIKKVEEIPTMKGIRVFIGSRTTDHGPRIKVSNLRGDGIFEDKNKYVSVFMDKGGFKYKDTKNKSEVNLDDKEKEEIEAFFLRNQDDIREYWYGNDRVVDGDELVRRIHDTEMAYYEEKFNVKEKNTKGKDLYYNIDKIDNGTRKVIYVTGYSGSGKSTLRKELSERYPNLIGISGDHIVMTILNNLEGSVPYKWDLDKSEIKNKIGEIPYSYLINNMEWMDISSSLTGNKYYDFFNPELARYFYDFIVWLEDESRKPKYNKYVFVVEGMQILTIPDLEFYKDKPLVIKGTSAMTSYVRKQKRDIFGDMSTISWDKIKNSMIKMIPRYMEHSGYMDELKRVMDESSIQESDIYAPFSGGYIKSPFMPNDFIYTADMFNRKLKKYHQEGKYTCIQPRDTEWDDGAVVFAQYTISKKEDEVDVINFINEMNNWINNSILVGEVETPAYMKEKGMLILRDVQGYLGESAVVQESQEISREKIFNGSVALLKKEILKYPHLKSKFEIEPSNEQWAKSFIDGESDSCMIGGVSIWDVIPNARETPGSCIKGNRGCGRNDGIDSPCQGMQYFCLVL